MGQAADAIGYPCYEDERSYSRRSNGDDYMTMCIWEYRDKMARSFLVYLSRKGSLELKIKDAGA
ncbi:MAG: hypothetical protein K2O34_02140 [Acetatifactor sp.]|nr:hypothetical protein [Acetatifactor sp.]